MNNLRELFVVDVPLSVLAKLTLNKLTVKVERYHLTQLCVTNNLLEAVEADVAASGGVEQVKCALK